MTVKPTIGANRADGDVVTAAQYNNDVVAQGLYAQEVIAGTNADKIPTSAISGVVGFYPNLLVNGGMEIAQRGTGAFTATGGGVVSVDRWTAAVASTGALSVQQATTQLDTGSAFSLVMNCTVGNGSTAYGEIFQNVENFGELKGRTVYLTVRAYCNTASACYCSVQDGVSTPISSFHTGNSTWQTLTVSLAVSASATRVTAFIFTIVPCLAYIDNVMLAASSAAVNYTPRPYAEEMTLCKRYYQKLKLSTRWRTSAATEIRDTNIYYQQAMPGVPTSAVTTGTRANITSGTVADITADGARMEYTATATTTDTQALNEFVTMNYEP